MLNTMRLQAITLIVGLAGLAATGVRGAAPAYALPQVPDTIEDFRARADYYVARFWDTAPLEKKGVARGEGFEASFDAWLSPMEIATADTVYAAVGRLMGRLAKRGDDQLYVASLAESRLYSDSAMLPADELYRAFLLPVLRNKKIEPALKARYSHQFTVLGNSLTGYPLAPLTYTGADGADAVLEPLPGVVTLLFVNDPDCLDCRLARTRLVADLAVERLVGEGRLRVVALSLCDPADPLLAPFREPMPTAWTLGANETLDDQLDLRGDMPRFYLIDENGRTAAKNLNVDQVLTILNRL